jgi:hypothetical protein
MDEGGCHRSSGKKANRSAAGPDSDSIYLWQGDMKSMHPEPVHADLCKLGMKTSFGYRIQLDVGKTNNLLARRRIGKTQNSTQRHFCSSPKQKDPLPGLLQATSEPDVGLLDRGPMSNPGKLRYSRQNAPDFSDPDFSDPDVGGRVRAWRQPPEALAGRNVVFGYRQSDRRLVECWPPAGIETLDSGAGPQICSQEYGPGLQRRPREGVGRRCSPNNFRN